jgi:hypothetical protein
MMFMVLSRPVDVLACPVRCRCMQSAGRNFPTLSPEFSKTFRKIPECLVLAPLDPMVIGSQIAVSEGKGTTTGMPDARCPAPRDAWLSQHSRLTPERQP